MGVMSDLEIHKRIRTPKEAWVNVMYFDDFTGLSWVKITEWVPWVMPNVCYFVHKRIKDGSIHPSVVKDIPKEVIDYIFRNKRKPVVSKLGVNKGFGKLPF